MYSLFLLKEKTQTSLKRHYLEKNIKYNKKIGKSLC